jgi:transcriptional regulator with XRE-family HTH domain
LKTIEEIFIQNVKDRMKKLGLSQKKLAEKAKISATTMNRILKGKQKPQPANLFELSVALRCSREDLYRDDSKAEKKPDSIVALALENESLRAEIARLNSLLTSQASNDRPSSLAPDRSKERALIERARVRAQALSNKKDSKEGS